MRKMGKYITIYVYSFDALVGIEDDMRRMYGLACGFEVVHMDSVSFLIYLSIYFGNYICILKEA